MMKSDLTARERLIFAMDVSTIEEVESWVGLLNDHIGAFKVGKQLFTACGSDVLNIIHDRGGKIFLDLKFHDIPNTVAEAIRKALRPGVMMIDIHALGGFEMMVAAKEAVEQAGVERKPMLLAVTLLTSINRESLADMGIAKNPMELVLNLSYLTKRAGLDGVVASPLEAEVIRKEMGEDFLIVSPGIRLSNGERHDQRRVSTPKDAIEGGADYLVVGRPIKESHNPLSTVKGIIKEIEGALSC